MATGARVVVGVGESLAALQALRYAVAEARRRGWALRAVRVWQAGTPWHGYDVDLGRRPAGADPTRPSGGRLSRLWEVSPETSTSS